MERKYERKYEEREGLSVAADHLQLTARREVLLLKGKKPLWVRCTIYRVYVTHTL